MPIKSRYPDIDIPKVNVLTYFFGDGKNLPSKPLWIDAANPSKSLSLVQALSWVKRFGLGLDRLGIPELSSVMIFCPNHIYVPIMYLGTVGSKRYFTGANPMYNVNEVVYQMKLVEARLVLVHPSLLETGIAAAKEAKIPLSRLYQFSDKEMPTSPEGIKDWRTFIASENEAESWQWDPLEGEAAVNTMGVINFSSGTTGFPKGVCTTHYNLVANAMQASYNKFNHPLSPPRNPNESFLGVLPLYHVFGQLWTIYIAGKNGIPSYIMEKFVFLDYLKYIEKYKVTTLQSVPPMVVMLSKRPEVAQFNLTCINSILCGAAPLGKDIQNDVSKKLGCVISQAWGMTETTAMGIAVPGNIHDDSGCIGQVIRNTEAKLIDENGIEITRDNTPGELLLRGPQIMKGYWKNPQATLESIDPEGWLHTGDVGIKKDDWFWIVDRIKELIKVNGLQVAPAELEAVMLEHEAILDAAAVGITLHGEELPRGYVVLHESFKGKVKEQDIQKFVASKVSRHKHLAGGVRFVDEVPKLPSGKIVRKVLKSWSKEDAKVVENQMKPRL